MPGFFEGTIAWPLGARQPARRRIFGFCPAKGLISHRFMSFRCALALQCLRKRLARLCSRAALHDLVGRPLL